MSTDTTWTNHYEDSTGPAECELTATPAQLQSGFGIAGDAFYDDVPLTAAWQHYQEPLAFWPTEWADDRYSWR